MVSPKRLSTKETILRTPKRSIEHSIQLKLSPTIYTPTQNKEKNNKRVPHFLILRIVDNKEMVYFWNSADRDKENRTTNRLVSFLVECEAKLYNQRPILICLEKESLDSFLYIVVFLPFLIQNYCIWAVSSILSL